MDTLPDDPGILDPNAVDLDSPPNPEPEYQLLQNASPELLQDATPATLESWEYPEIEDRRKRLALGVYRKTWQVSAACRAIRANRSTHYRWLESDPAYAAAVEEMNEAVADSMEREAYRRAVEGVSEPTGWYKGKAGAWVKRYSDNLLMFLSKGNRPEKYADRMELKGAMANLDLTQLPDHLLERIAAGEHPLAVLASAAAPALQPGASTVETGDSDDPESGPA